MGASAGLLAALLWLSNVLLGLVTCNSSTCLDETPPITIRLEAPRKKTVPIDQAPAHQAPAALKPSTSTDKRQPTEAHDYEFNSMHDDTVELPADASPTRDWHEIARESAIHIVDARFEYEKTREALWRQTGSVMFADTGEFNTDEPATIINDLKFRVPVGVLGIGITIGGCFIGIPLAGIPVEERTVGPNVIYCKDRYE